MKLALRLSDQAASSVFEYKLVTLSQLLGWNLFFWSGPSLQTLLASNRFHNTDTSNVSRSLVVQFHRTMFHGHSSLSDMSS